MNRSENIAQLAAALAKAQGQMENASKSAANPFFKSSYADLSSIVGAIKAPLSSNGIAYVQTTDTNEGGVIVETTLLHASGEWLSSQLRMRPVKDDPQGIGSCLTYARRYALQAIVGLAAEDDDGNDASGNGQKGVAQRDHTARPVTLVEHPASKPAPAKKGTLTPPSDEDVSDLSHFLKWAYDGGLKLADICNLLGVPNQIAIKDKYGDFRKAADALMANVPQGGTD